ncbi:MAG: phytanoyl-CoA dioxygenase family protein [Mycolicibacterium sp.]|uniref:phytanoyl-CoA dioxygenase family protein n=1 Tax=Mycolicibacterium sp. TaxID=2320850 RepID=UPI003D0E60E7
MILIDTARMARLGLAARLKRARRTEPECDEVKDWIRSVRNEGVCAVPNFYDPATCERLRQEVLDIAENNPEAVQMMSNDADRRIFGAEHAARGIRAFAEDSRLLNAARTMLGGDAANAFTLAGIIAYRPGNLGSGEGWHRDSFFNQFKAIVYLTDVTVDNGPFEYITRSHRTRQKFSDHAEYGIPLNSTRIDDASVGKLIAAESERHRILTAAKGTLLLVDTTGIHRGMPLIGGERYALTNYYLPGKALKPKLFDSYAPLLGWDVPVSAPI